MGDPRSVVDLVTEQVVERLRTEADQRIGDMITVVKFEAQRRLDEAIAAAIPEPIALEPIVVDDTKSDAKNRARRTLLQGLVVTVVVALLIAVAGALKAPGFDFLDAGAWKTVAGTAIGAMLMAAAAYIQRFIDPPKG